MKNAIQKIKDKHGDIIKKILSILYFAGTSAVPIAVFRFNFFTRGTFIAVVLAYIALIIMDIVCSIMEDGVVFTYNYLTERKIRLELEEEKRKKEEEKRKKEMEEKARKSKEEAIKILEDKKNHTSEIKGAEENNKQLREEAIKNKNKLPKTVYRRLREICDKVDNTIDFLRKRPQEYDAVKLAFEEYYPKFKDMTIKFINIYNTGSIENEDEYEDEFLTFANEVDQYLDFAKSHIVTASKKELDVDMMKLIKQLKAERQEVDV